MASAKTITFDFEIRNHATGELQKISAGAKTAGDSLSKMGTMAQSAIQQVGRETKQTAILTALATQNVSAMNAALAQTSAVPMQQLSGALVDINSGVAEFTQQFQSAVSFAADITTITMGVAELNKVLGITATVTKVLNTALIAGGIVGAIALVASLTTGFWGAKEATEGLTEAQERQQRVAQAASTAYGQASAQLQINIQRLKDFNGTRAEEQKLVDEMNGTYGKQMGYFESVADWYKALTENAESYCKMLVNQARLEELARQAAGIEKQRHEILYNADGTRRKYTKNEDIKKDEATGEFYAYRTVLSPVANGFSGEMTSKTIRVTGLDKLKDYYSEDDNIGAGVKYNELGRELKSAYGQMAALSKEIGRVNFPVKGATTSPGTPRNSTPTSLGPALTPGQKRGQDLTIDAWDLETVEEYTARIDKLRELQQTANRKQYAELQRQIDQVESIKSAFESLGEVTERLGGRMVIPAKPLDSMKSTVNNALGITDFDGKRPGDLQPTQGARKLAEKNEDEKKKEPEPAKFEIGKLQGGWGGIKSGVNAVTSLTNAVRQGADAWTIMQTAIDGVFQMLQSVQSVMQMVNMLIQLGTASKKTDATVTLTNTGVTEADTGAKVANAAAGFFAAHSWIPWVGLGLGVAAVAAMMATMGGLPKFARGGIAYGPTLGLFGEYPGASSNPEVVAPLSRLKSLMGEPDTGLNGGVVEFHIKGRDLEGVLQKRNKLMQRI